MSNQVLEFPREVIQCRIIKPSSEEIQNRTFKLVASDETPIDRFSYDKWEPYILIVSHEKGHIKTDRIDSGVCLFFENHPGLFSDSKRLGKVRGFEIVDKQLILEIKLNRSEEADRYLQDLEDDTQPGNSIGFVINKLEVIRKATYEPGDEDGYRRKLKEPMIAKAIDWELHEVSAVDIPANPNAGKFNDKNELQTIELYPVEIIGDTGMGDNFMNGKLETNYKGRMSGQNDNKKSEDVINPEIKKLSEERDLLRQESVRANLISEYWRLRSQATDLYALKNQLTQEEFSVDFSEKPENDINKLIGMSAEDAGIELKTINRALERAAKKSPIERLSDSDRAIVSNNTIAASNVQFDGVITRSPQEKTPGNISTEKYAQQLVEDL